MPLTLFHSFHFWFWQWTVGVFVLQNLVFLTNCHFETRKATCHCQSTCISRAEAPPFHINNEIISECSAHDERFGHVCAGA